MLAIDAVLSRYARRTILTAGASLATIPLRASRASRAWLAIDAILSVNAMLAIDAVLSRYARRTILTAGASLATIPLRASRACRAWLAVNAVLAAGASRAWLAIDAILSVNAMLAIDAVLSRYARRTILTAGASLTTIPLRARRACRPRHTPLAHSPLQAAVAGDALLAMPTLATDQTSQARNSRHASREPGPTPQAEIAPPIMFRIPHPQHAGRLLIPGVANSPASRQALGVFNNPEHGTNRGEMTNGHASLLGLENRAGGERPA